MVELESGRLPLRTQPTSMGIGLFSGPRWGHFRASRMVATAMAEPVVFEILAWGERVGAGASDSHYCTLEAVAKLNSENSPFTIANEFICGRLGDRIGLPVPPFAMARTDDGAVAFVSLRFGPKGERPPKVIPEHLATDHASLATGIILFDSWVLTPDRHDENLAYSREGIPPAVLDHSHALLGSGKEAPSLDPAAPHIAGCLTPELASSAYFDEWMNRIKGVPEWFVNETIGQVVKMGCLAAEVGDDVAHFLIPRKSRIMEFVQGSQGAFPKITQWTLSTPASGEVTGDSDGD
jgi:hypothetical protein